MGERGGGQIQIIAPPPIHRIWLRICAEKTRILQHSRMQFIQTLNELFLLITLMIYSVSWCLSEVQLMAYSVCLMVSVRSTVNDLLCLSHGLCRKYS